MGPHRCGCLDCLPGLPLDRLGDQAHFEEARHLCLQSEKAIGAPGATVSVAVVLNWRRPASSALIVLIVCLSLALGFLLYLYRSLSLWMASCFLLYIIRETDP